MNAQQQQWQQKLFYSAAWFNWLVGLGMLLAYPQLLPFLGTPTPELGLFVQLFAYLVLIFGLGYYLISRNPQAERSLILLGIVGKLGVFTLPLIYAIQGTIGWPLPLLASVDLIYALLFGQSLRSLTMQPQS